MLDATTDQKRLRALEEAVARLADQLRAANNKASAAYQGIGQGGGGGGNDSLFLGYITADVPARSGNTVGTGTVKRVSLSGTTATYTGGTDITNAFNVTGGIITSPAYVAYGRCAGRWLIFLADCKNTVSPAAPGTAPAAPTDMLAAID